MVKKSFGSKVREFLIGKPEVRPTPAKVQTKKVEIPGQDKEVPLPTTRSSFPHQPPAAGGNILSFMGNTTRVVNRPFIAQIIPLIRKLMMINPDVGQAIHNIIALGNTGHKVCFDRGVDPDMVDQMRNHLDNKKLIWSAGCAGMDGLINKMFAQLLVAGAVSTEWVPNKQLNGIETCILVNPEDIVFVLEEGNIKYTPYQRIETSSGWITPVNALNATNGGLNKLNPYTYRYYGLNGDTEVPYGFPPYLSALDRVRTQANMQTNIDYIVDTMGLVGFLEVLVGVPDQEDGESKEDYNIRLDNVLIRARDRISEGMKSGVVTGFKDEHEIKFNSINRSLKEAIELFQNNELMLASGIKMDAALLGRGYSTTETQITVVFMKMLSELRNIQNVIKHNLQYGYALELTLAGFNFKYLKVQFNRSTLQDDYKYQQAEDLKVQNVKNKMIMGIIDQETAADELGYENPAFAEPMVSWEVLAGGSDPAPIDGSDTPGSPKKRAGQKKDAKKKTRDNNKPVNKY